MYSNPLEHQIKKIEAQQQQEPSASSIPIYQVDAFSSSIFGGNPAAVCLLDRWLTDHKLQQIAAENNLSETAFCVRSGYLYELRWFTPTVEVDLCGHATLAAAHVLFSYVGLSSERIIFKSKSGELRVSRIDENKYTLDFPEDIPKVLSIIPDLLLAGLPEGIKIVELLKGKTDYVLILESEEVVETLEPNLNKWKELVAMRGIIVSAKGNQADFVSRCFYPQSGVDEDPVTGSAHTTLSPYWAEKIGKQELTAVQLSNRRGEIHCQWKNQRVFLTGMARTYLKGEIYLT